MEHLTNTSVDLVEVLCSTIARPIEVVLRPFHSTRYFAGPVVFFSSALMVLLPLISAAIAGIQSMIPFAGAPACAIGLFDLGNFAEAYAAISAVHFFRLWRRMVEPQREEHSHFEGPPLPFFQLIPWSRSFWKTRILLEPFLVLLLATVLQDLLIIQSGLALYLRIAALALAVKQFLAWYQAWSYVRDLLDAQSAGPIIARLVDNKASAEDLAAIHIASFPENLSPDLRDSAAVSIARAFSPSTYNAGKGEHHEAAHG